VSKFAKWISLDGSDCLYQFGVPVCDVWVLGLSPSQAGEIGKLGLIAEGTFLVGFRVNFNVVMVPIGYIVSSLAFSGKGWCEGCRS
jgi:hypothetical protein